MEKRPTVIRPAKVAAVQGLVERLGRSNMAILTDYRGLTVAQLSNLRRQLRPMDVEVRVVKNTLARLAAQEAGCVALLPALDGPTAVVFGYGDPVAMAKTLTETIRSQRLSMQLKGALLGAKFLAPADVGRLADLPTREILIAQVLGSVQAPISAFVGTLGGILQSLVGVLDARRQQLEGA